MALLFVPSLVAKPGIVKARMSRARPVEPVHRLGRDDERVGRVEAAADADDDLGLPVSADGAQPLLEPGDLDVVGLVAVEREARPRRRGRRGSGRPCGAARCRRSAASSASSMVRKPSPCAAASGAAVVVEGALPLPLLAQQVEVDVGHRRRGPSGKRSLSREQVAVLVDHRHAVPRQVGRALPLAGRGIEVGGEAARRARCGRAGGGPRRARR